MLSACVGVRGSCNAGYEIVGSASRTCLLGSGGVGVWNGTMPYCGHIANYCPELFAPANGVMGNCSSRRLGDICAPFECNVGYYLSNATLMTTRTCLVDQQLT